MGVWVIVIFFYGVFLWSWCFSSWHTFQNYFRLSIYISNFRYFPPIIRKCMLFRNTWSSFSWKVLLVSHSTMWYVLKLIGKLNHVYLELFVSKIAIFSIFWWFLPIFGWKFQFLCCLYIIMNFHATSLVKSSTETTFCQIDMPESTVNTQFRPLKKTVSQIIYFWPYSPACDFMSQCHAQILIKHGEFINMPTTMQIVEFRPFFIKNAIF